MSIVSLNYILNFIDKNGIRHHSKSLVSCEHPSHVGEKERLIYKSDAVKGLGIKYCRSCCVKGKSPSEESRKKMSLAQRGKIVSQEARDKMSKSHIGKHDGEKNSFYGKHHSEETKRKIRESNKGEKSSLYGTHHSVEWREKIGLSQKGEKNHRWRQDLTQAEREDNKNRTRNPKTLEFRQLIYKRDNWTCQITGPKNIKLAVHHLYNWADHPDKRFDPNNGITISEAYHKLFHKIYGKRHNTPEQFEEFKRNILSL